MAHVGQGDECPPRKANDAVNAFIFNPSQVSVSRKGLKGLWANSPVAANDLSQVSWQ